MNFDYNEEQQLLADSVRRYLAKSYDFEARKKIVTGQGWSAQAWAQFAEMGLMGLPVSAEHGGFGRAPKFPPASAIEFLLRRGELEPATRTLDGMALGGMYDLLGGGFHRYSVDERWLVPHFEKMLYDNSQLVVLYLDAYRASGDEFFLAVGEDVLRYVTREMVSPEGGFYSTQDADSEGVEGKFFVWERAEVMRLLGEEVGEIFCRVYDVTDVGNFEHHNILHVTLSEEQAAKMFRKEPAEIRRLLADARRRLFEAREHRVKPMRDEKILAAWNGLMLSAYAEAFGVTGNHLYREIAERGARFVSEKLCSKDRLLHAYKDGIAKVPGFLDDYAAFVPSLQETGRASRVGRALGEADDRALLGPRGRRLLLYRRGSRAVDRAHQARNRRIGAVREFAGGAAVPAPPRRHGGE